jgi:RNA-directed DNA polymerase
MSGQDEKPFDVPRRLVWQAWKRVAVNGGAPGADGVTIEDFKADLGNNLYKIWNRMSPGAYFPPPVRAVEIPKSSGGTRILGVPAVGDRVAQTVAAMALEPARSTSSMMTPTVTGAIAARWMPSARAGSGAGNGPG